MSVKAKKELEIKVISLVEEFEKENENFKVQSFYITRNYKDFAIEKLEATIVLK